MADAASTTVHRHPAMDAHDLALAATAREWEGPLGDLLDMSGLTTDYIEDLMTRCKKGDVHYINDQQVQRALYAVYKVHHMVRDFREQYYEALEAR